MPIEGLTDELCAETEAGGYPVRTAGELDDLVNRALDMVARTLPVHDAKQHRIAGRLTEIGKNLTG